MCLILRSKRGAKHAVFSMFPCHVPCNPVKSPRSWNLAKLVQANVLEGKFHDYVFSVDLYGLRAYGRHALACVCATEQTIIVSLCAQNGSPSPPTYKVNASLKGRLMYKKYLGSDITHGDLYPSIENF